MANTLRMFLPFLTGGLEDIELVSGTPTISTTVNSGDYALLLNDSADKIYEDGGFAAATPTNTTAIIVFRVSDVTPANALTLLKHFDYLDGLIVSLKTDGDIEVETNNGGVAGTFTPSLTADAWHTLRIDTAWSATVGKIDVTIDGGTAQSYTGLNLVFDIANEWTYGSGGGISTDFYIDVVAMWDTGATFAPTDLPDKIAKSKGFTSGVNSTTDLGATVWGSGWRISGEIPVSGSGVGIYDKPQISGTDTDTDYNSENRDGPSGATFTPAIGTILAAKVGVQWRRGGGSASAQHIYYGNSSETWPTGLGKSPDMDIGTSNQWDSIVFEGSHVPTTSQFFRLGLETTGGQDIDASFLGAAILYEPASTGGWGGKVGGVSSPAKVGGVEPGAVGGV